MFQFQYNDIDISHKLDKASSPTDEYFKHMHPFVEIVFFTSGKVEYNVEGEKRRLKTNDCIFIMPGKLHFAEVDRGVLYERYVLKFPEALIPKHLLQFFKESSPFYRLNNDAVSIFKSLDYFYQLVNDENMECIAHSKILELLIILNLLKKEEGSPDRTLIILQITNYIQNHLEENIVLGDIAKELSYSESYISSYFKKEMHISIMKYIRTKKIIYAHTLIQNGEKPYEVCEKMKFNDYSTFYRQYLRVVGISPSDDYKKSK